MPPVTRHLRVARLPVRPKHHKLSKYFEIVKVKCRDANFRVSTFVYEIEFFDSVNEMSDDNQHQTTGTPGEAFERLVEIIARLRAPDGCPWDREQTHHTLRAHLLEETYETLDAIEREDDDDLREELGDLMLQPVLHAQIASEIEPTGQARFDIVDVLETISDKLVRRHPHVFGEVTVSSSGEVLVNWDAIKQQERAAKLQKEGAQSTLSAPDATSVLDDVPIGLPSLLLALKVSKKAAKVGFEWPDLAGVFDKLSEETRELEIAIAEQKTAPSEANQKRVAEELGDLLFTAVNIARWNKVDPELALRDMVARFSVRFRAMEKEAQTRELDLQTLSPAQWDDLWTSAKKGI